MANRRFLNWLWPFNWINRVPSQLARIVLRLLTIIVYLCIMANAYHLVKVFRYPLVYNFPEHSFRIVDSETGEPMEGVLAVYIYEQFNVYEYDLASIFEQFFDPILLFSDLSTWRGRARVGLSEALSDANGTLTMTQYGPLRRRRNHYLHDSQPGMFLFRSGYEIVERYNENKMKSAYLGFPAWIRPDWTGSEIAMTRFSEKSDNWGIKKGFSVDQRYNIRMTTMFSNIFSSELKVENQDQYFKTHIPQAIQIYQDELASRDLKAYEMAKYDLRNWIKYMNKLSTKNEKPRRVYYR